MASLIPERYAPLKDYREDIAAKKYCEMMYVYNGQEIEKKRGHPLPEDTY